MESISTIVPVRNAFIRDPVFVTGLPRSGKWMLSSILSSFKRSEYLSVDYLMEQVVMANASGLIREDVSECLLKYAVDLKAYNIFTGRDSNIRPGDYTSIWKSGRILKFIKRLFAKEGTSVLKEIEEKKPLFIFLVHNALWHFKLYKRSFPLLKMIHIRRHPIDVVASWFKKGYGLDMKDKFYNGTFTIKAEDKHLFYYTGGKEKEYSKMCEADRVIYMVKGLEENHNKAYCDLNDNEKKIIKKIYFEKFVVDPNPYLNELAEFLKTEKTKHTFLVCKKQKCPRVLNMYDKEIKINNIKKYCSDSAYQALVQMSTDYEKNMK